mgnify:CR=1 FL=1
MQNWLGIAVSFIYVFGILGIAQLLLYFQLASPPVSRKLVHIGVAHWWLLAIPFFDSVAYALVGPVAFTVLNAISLRRHLFPAMEAPRQPGKPVNLGTIYFPVSLTILVLVTFLTEMPTWVGGLGILVLGWGDGMAAVVGMAAGRIRYTVFRQRKSLIGSATMFGVSFGVVLLYSYVQLPLNAGMLLLSAAATAAVATATEAATPLGMDNLSIPTVTALFYYGVFL